MPLYAKFIVGYLAIGCALAFYMSVKRRIDRPSTINDVENLSAITSMTQFLFIACWPIWWPLWLREKRKHREEREAPNQPPETTRGK